MNHGWSDKPCITIAMLCIVRICQVCLSFHPIWCSWPQDMSWNLVWKEHSSFLGLSILFFPEPSKLQTFETRDEGTYWIYIQIHPIQNSDKCWEIRETRTKLRDSSAVQLLGLRWSCPNRLCHLHSFQHLHADQSKLMVQIYIDISRIK